MSLSCVFLLFYVIKSYGPSHKQNDDWLIYFVVNFDILEMICDFKLTNLKLSVNDLLWLWYISICVCATHSFISSGFVCIIISSINSIIIFLCMLFATVFLLSEPYKWTESSILVTGHTEQAISQWVQTEKNHFTQHFNHWILKHSKKSIAFYRKIRSFVFEINA